MRSFRLTVVGALLGVTNAVLQSSAVCERNNTDVGDYCDVKSGLACAENLRGGLGYCIKYACSTTLAPSKVITASPTTVTVASATKTAYTTLALPVDSCIIMCSPTLTYTTTVKYPSTLPKPTATLGLGDYCAASGTAKCQTTLACIDSGGGAQCSKASCVDGSLATKTVTSQSTITSAPNMATITATVTSNTFYQYV
ncbi:hypothetical protein BKA62DRAFT_803117 [Auriculariales sp. MPI-PUGE-AT-0066]|nr:hypothetical protein BKA62DRAFT_803117 [Auriculariales sp. MPI-PUGE-AT-0066]